MNIETRESWRNVGQKVRHLRKENQLTIKQLAIGCDLSPNAISLLERGEVAPTVATLCRIAAALGAPVSCFFEEACPTEVTLTRAEERSASHLSGQVLSAFKCALPPAEDVPLLVDEEEAESSADYSHQFVLCLSGQIEYQVNGQSHHLGPGDSLSFNGSVRHYWRNLGPGPAVAVMVLDAGPEPDEES